MPLIVGILGYPFEQADKKARAEKAAKEKALRAGEVPAQPAAASGSQLGGAASIAAAAGGGMKGKDYPETRLQVSRRIFREGSHDQLIVVGFTDSFVYWRRSFD